MRTEEWKEQFPWRDTAVSRSTEPAYGGSGGARGFSLNQGAGFDTRLGDRMRNYPIRTAGWMLVLCGVLLVMA